MKIGPTSIESGQTKTPGYLDGQILVAMPTIQDDRFARTVIYMCAHSPEGAMGIVINKPAPNVKFHDLLEQLDVIPKETGEPIRISAIPVLKGGPVETQRGFVLHSADFFIKDSTLSIDQDICLTATLDILKALARGEGPTSAILALGYAGWAPGQLESEIQANGWLNCAADDQLIFGSTPEAKYATALRKIGIDPAQLSTDAGHA
ncbi:MAG TPA: YqgE/AlgH family protein [Xanthobacteraceae bacterium]|jgi:putative transcriptional regulator|nr:YqgE/AlgH family protein [Xanthobacteraceae bacterium]